MLPANFTVSAFLPIAMTFDRCGKFRPGLVRFIQGLGKDIPVMSRQGHHLGIGKDLPGALLGRTQQNALTDKPAVVAAHTMSALISGEVRKPMRSFA